MSLRPRMKKLKFLQWCLILLVGKDVENHVLGPDTCMHRGYHLVSPLFKKKNFGLTSFEDNLHFGRVGMDFHGQTPFELNETAMHYYLMIILA